MTMTPAEVAAADQAGAREREFDRKAATVARVLLALYLLAGLYAAVALAGYLPVAPWSPAAGR